MIEQNAAATEILFLITGETGPGLIFVKKDNYKCCGW